MSSRPIDAVIAGAQKGGTTSLAYYLGQHPEICTHERLEFSYFSNDLDYAEGYEKSFRRYFAHCDLQARLLAKSVTIMTESRLVKRLKAHSPDVRVIVVLRNPVDRAYSAFWWARKSGYEPLTRFEDALDANPARHGGDIVRVRSTAYLPFGEYAGQVEGLFDEFGRQRVLVVLFDDLQRDTPSVVRSAFEFLGVDPSFRPEMEKRNVAGRARSGLLARLLTGQSRFKRRIRAALPRGWAEGWKRRAEAWNTASFRPPPMHPDTRRRLSEHFAPHNERLSTLIGADLSGWAEATGERG